MFTLNIGRTSPGTARNLFVAFVSKSSNKERECCNNTGLKTFVQLVPHSGSSYQLKNVQFPSIYRKFRTAVVLFEEVTVRTPRFPESVTEGDLRWSKKEGDPVAVDEVVCEIETDKTAITVPSTVGGILLKRLVEDGATVAAGQALFVVKVGSQASTEPSPILTAEKSETDKSKRLQSSAKKDVAQSVSKLTLPTATSPGPMKLPTGKSGPSVFVRVPSTDPTAIIAGTRSEFKIPMNKMRLRIGQRLKEAQATTAMLTTFNEVDMSNLISFRKNNQDAFFKKHGVKLGFMSAFVKGACYALQEQPIINSVIDGSDILYRDFVDISVAVATPRGLVIPVLRNVDHMDFAEIEKELVRLADKGKKGTLAVDDMSGGTFTITNGGVFGSLLSTPIINMPQSAILGMHATQDRPMAVGGKVEIRPMMYVALTYDHRLVDGREAVLFLKKIKNVVEDLRIILAGI